MEGLTQGVRKLELNNKCIKLRSGLGRIQDPPQGLQEILSGLDALLRVSGTSIEWNYLNSGTHDSQREHEFSMLAREVEF